MIIILPSVHSRPFRELSLNASHIWIFRSLAGDRFDFKGGIPGDGIKRPRDSIFRAHAFPASFPPKTCGIHPSPRIPSDWIYSTGAFKIEPDIINESVTHKSRVRIWNAGIVTMLQKRSIECNRTGSAIQAN